MSPSSCSRSSADVVVGENKEGIVCLVMMFVLYLDFSWDCWYHDENEVDIFSVRRPCICICIFVFVFVFVFVDDDEVDIFSVRRPFPISAGVDICLGAPPQLDIDDQLHHIIT